MYKKMKTSAREQKDSVRRGGFRGPGSRRGIPPNWRGKKKHQKWLVGTGDFSLFFCVFCLECIKLRLYIFYSCSEDISVETELFDNLIEHFSLQHDVWPNIMYHLNRILQKWLDFKVDSWEVTVKTPSWRLFEYPFCISASPPQMRLYFDIF